MFIMAVFEKSRDLFDVSGEGKLTGFHTNAKYKRI